MPPVSPSRIFFPFNVIESPARPLRGWGLYMAIADWPESERPRERLLAQGAGALSDAELLAVMLRTGVRGRSAVDLGRDLLARCGGIGGLLRAGLQGQKGLGP